MAKRNGKTDSLNATAHAIGASVAADIERKTLADVPRTLLENVRDALTNAERATLANAPTEIVAQLEREQRDFTGKQANANTLAALDLFIDKAYTQGVTPAMRQHGHFLVNQLRGQ